MEASLDTPVQGARHFQATEGPRSSERDLFDFARLALRYWTITLVAMVAGAVIAGGLTAVIPLTSVARIVVAPLAEKDDALNAADQTRTTLTVGNLLGGRAPPEIDSYYSTIESMGVVLALLKQGQLAQDLFPKQWDASNGVWRAPSGVLAEASSGLRAWLGLPPRLQPDDPALVHAELLRITTFKALDKDFAPSSYELDLKLSRPEVARSLLSALHNETLAEIRQRAVVRTSALVTTLHRLYDETQVQDYRQTLAKMIADQEQKLMLLQNPSYPVAVEVIDPPAIVVPLQRSLTVWAVVGAGLGALVTLIILFVVWLRNWANEEISSRIPTPDEKVGGSSGFRVGSSE